MVHQYDNALILAARFLLAETETSRRGKDPPLYFLVLPANIHKQSRAESRAGATVHPSPREMAVSSPTVVRNHRQSPHDTLLYGGTFYILLSSPGKIKAKSSLSQSHPAAL